MQKLKNVILASFLAKLGWDTVRKKKNSFQLPFLLDPCWSILKKIKNNKIKLKNVILASFLVKSGRDKPKKGKNFDKNYSGFTFCQIRQGQAKKEKQKLILGTVSTRAELEHSQKNCKKIQKGKKVILPSFLAKLS